MPPIDGLDLRERPWQPGLDDARFNRNPRNPYVGGASPEATAYQRTNDLRGMSATERPWTSADTKTFGTRPAGVPPSTGERLRGAADTARARIAPTGQALRDGWAGLAGRGEVGPPAPRTLRSAGRGAVRGLGAAGAVGLSALEEGAKVARVAADERASGLDVATQGAEAAGRVGASVAGGALGAKVGAGLGAFGGPLAPLTVPVGAVLGGAAGAYLGDWGAKKSIGGLRDFSGVAPESPAERLAATQSSAASQIQPSTTLRDGWQQTGAPAAAPPLPPAQPAPSLRDGWQQTSVPGVARSGNTFSDVPGLRDAAFQNRGAISPQNMAAADALAGRQSLRDMGGMPAPVPMAQAPQVRHSGNDWQARNDLRNLRVSANSITNRPEWSRGAVVDRRGRVVNGQADQDGSVAAYQAAFANDLRMRGGEPVLQADITKSNNTLRGAQIQADTSRYASDNSLRGDIFRAQGSAAAARQSALAGAQKDERDRLDKQYAAAEKRSEPPPATLTSGTHIRCRSVILPRISSCGVRERDTGADDFDHAGDEANEPEKTKKQCH